MLQRHEVRHTPCRQPQHCCDTCGARLMTIYSLNEHKRLSHVDERPFPCAICGFTAKCKYTTHTHVTHTHYRTMMSINCVHCTYPRVHMSTLSPQCHEESPVAAECCSTPHHRSQTLWPHYAGAMSTALASCSAASEFKLACLVRQALCGQMPIYLADDIHLVFEGNRRSLRSSSDNMCVEPRTHNSFGDRSFGAVAHEFGTVCRVAYGHWTSATNILKCCWRHICFDKATALCEILYKRFRNILTSSLTCPHYVHMSMSYVPHWQDLNGLSMTDILTVTM